MTSERVVGPRRPDADYATRYLGQIVNLTIDRPLGSTHPDYDELLYELNYGYVPGTLAPDGEEVDAYVLGVDRPVSEFTGRCVAVIRRADEEDDKLVLVPDGTPPPTDEEVRAATRFAEQSLASAIAR